MQGSHCINFVSSRTDQSTVLNQEWRVQNLKTKLQQFVGDWYKDIENGLPWLQDVLGQKPTKVVFDNAETLIKSEILSEDNQISSILEYNQEFLDRRLSINFNALDIEGNIINFQGVFP